MPVCTKCFVEKPLTEFSKNRTRRSGCDSRCKSCDRAKVRAYFLRNREVLNENRKHRPRSPPSKYKVVAKQMVREAIKSGLLTRPKVCSKCPSTTRIQAHHPDYSKPLDVMWLCQPCHMRLHRKDEAARAIAAIDAAVRGDGK